MPITLSNQTINTALTYVEKCYDLNSNEKNKLFDRLWTFSSKVRQPRKDDRSCNKTPYFDRWDTNNTSSHLTTQDPRYATQTECEKILLKLLILLLEAYDIDISKIERDNELIQSVLGRNLRLNSLKCIVTKKSITKKDIKESLKYSTQRLGSFEVPVGYIKELNVGGLHRSDNVGWIKPFHINYKLREFLRKKFIKSGGNSKSAKNALDKIQVKSYCTDKFTMPPFFSNRDIRWATWTNSNQYASHYNCCMIELELMCQLFEFTGAPKLSKVMKTEIKRTRAKSINEKSRRCYITGKKLSFTTYLKSSISPQGGKSAYHVSHINPLTRGGKHYYKNVEWISEDGNRIQGNDTIKEIESKLVDAVYYYIERKKTFPSTTKQKLMKLKRLISTRLGN